MAATYHARSNNLPSRQHPIVSQIDENLNRLRESQSTSTSSSIGHNLSGLQDLHECVDVLLQFPLTQQALAQEKQREMVEELLDESLMLLDVCTIPKDALLQTKECTQELQSILRRRHGVEGLANEFRKYLTSRKAMKKAICKALKNLKARRESKSSRWHWFQANALEESNHVENVQKELQSLGLSIQDLEEGLETLSRSMIKNRVTVLNIISC
ncbi:uncharacterized protein LOC108477641 [Gossypium arboreum]|uniref:uncharacterized protein LOC108477641 n=1 Tax=Gossypium arboreum TaxID=29729 RepID=UPI0022F1AB03|nr:uncharacterized protein LOC108477641 [Gossypium arboreum]